MILHPKRNKGKSTPIYAGGRVIGVVRGNTFYKRIPSKDFLRTPPAIGNSIDALDNAESVGADRMDVENKDTGQHYTATIELIRSKGLAFNRGFGAQIALTLAYWSINGKPPTNGPTPPPDEPQPEQYRLW